MRLEEKLTSKLRDDFFAAEALSDAQEAKKTNAKPPFSVLTAKD